MDAAYDIRLTSTEAAVRPEPQPLATGERYGRLFLLIGASALIAFATNFSMHLLNLRMFSNGASQVTIGASAAIQALGIMAAAPVLRTLTARLGVQRTFIGATVLTCGTLLTCHFVTHFTAIAVARALFAVGLGLLFTLSETLVVGHTTPQNRGKVVGIYATSLTVGTAAGPAFVAVTGIDDIVPFQCGVVLFMLPLIPVAASLASGEPKTAPVRESSFRALRMMPLAFVTAFVFGVVDNGGLSMLSVYGALAGFSYAQSANIAAAAMVGGIFLQIPLGYVSQKREPRVLLLACSVGIILSLAMLPSLVNSGLGAVAASFLFGGLLEGLYTIGLICIAKYCRDIGIASANGCFVSSCGFGEFVGPLLTGAGTQVFGSNGFVVVLLVAMGLYLASFTVWRSLR